MLTNETVAVLNNEELVQAYLALKAKEDELKAEKEALTKVIQAKLDEGVELSNGTSVLKFQPSRTFKYDDETAILTFLKKYKLTNFIKTAINAPELNKELKRKDTELGKQLAAWFHEEVVNKICIGKVCE